MSQQGIQQLLSAEKEAHAIIAQARAYRSDKLKAAKVDAADEIAKVKARKESELAAYEKLHSGLNDEADKAAEKQVADELAKIKAIAGDKRDKVIDLLVLAVTKPAPLLHANAA